MAGKTELIMYHGWGFGSNCWNLWKEALSSKKIKIKLFDRGYFGKPASPKFSKGNHSRIIFAHSFGLHLSPVMQLKKSDFLVIFGGFNEFHPRAAQFQRRSRSILQLTIQKFRKNPREVLEEFLKNTYYPANVPGYEFRPLDEQKLLYDLEALDRLRLENETLKKVSKICIVHGSEDGIVPKQKGRELYNQFRGKATYFEVKDAGHALPFTHTEQCLAFIKPELEQLIQ